MQTKERTDMDFWEEMLLGKAIAHHLQHGLLPSAGEGAGDGSADKGAIGRASRLKYNPFPTHTGTSFT